MAFLTSIYIHCCPEAHWSVQTKQRENIMDSNIPAVNSSRRINNRPIYIGKNQNPKNLGFLLYRLHCQKKPIAFGVFGTKSACAKKPESHTCVLVSGAHARLLSTFDRTRVVRITSRAAVGWFRWRSRTTWPKTRIIPARLERAFTLAKNQWNFGGVSKNHAAEVGFFDSGFLECLGEVA